MSGIKYTVAASDLHKEYNGKRGKKLALDRINIEVPEGSFFGLLGPNGAGKSTFINILAGLVNKTSGKASICGYDIDIDTKQARRNIGIVPQELVLDPFFTPLEALEYNAGFYGVPKSERRTMEIIKAMGLEDKKDASPRSLSGGMRRRLLIGKALVHSPKVLVLDEPTAGVDVELRQQLWDYVKFLNKDRGTTIVLTTHYLEEAETLCDKIAVIDKGKIIANDSKANILKLIDHKVLTVIPRQEITKIPVELERFSAKLNKEGHLEITYIHRDKNSVTNSKSINSNNIADVGEILTIIAKEKIEIADLITKQPSLEEVFMLLTNTVSKSNPN